MRHDNGVKLALGAMAALGVAAAAASRQGGSRSERRASTRTVRFDVEIPMDYEAAGRESYSTQICIEWDGNPDTYPTRQDVIRALIGKADHQDLDEFKESVEEYGLENVAKWADDDPANNASITVSGQDEWKIQPVNLKVRTALGGRQVCLVDDRLFGAPPDWMKS
jgi:hypothetical protein